MTSKANRLATALQDNASDGTQQRLDKILEEIGNLSDVDKLLLYLKLPTGALTQVKSEPTAFSKPELSSAVKWMKSHLEEDAELCLAKQQVYDEYREFCKQQEIRLVGREDFGKLMKSVFPNVTSRRLGTRGQTKHCYGGLTKRSDLPAPALPAIEAPHNQRPQHCTQDDASEKRVDLAKASCALICEWAEKLWQLKFTSIHDVAEYLIRQSYVNCNSEAAYTIMSQIHQFREDNNLTAPADLHCQVKSSAMLSTRGAKHELYLKLCEKRSIKEHKQKLEQQRCAMTGETCREDSSSQDTNTVSNETSMSSDSTSNHGQTKSGRGWRLPSSVTPKPILPKPPTPAFSNGSHGNGTPPVIKQESIATGSKLVLVSPTTHPPQPVMMVSSARPQHTKLVSVPPIPGRNSKVELNWNTDRQSNSQTNTHSSGRQGAESPVTKRSDAANVVSKALSKAMANSQGSYTFQGSSRNATETRTNITDTNSPSETSQNNEQFNTETFHRSHSAPGIDRDKSIDHPDLTKCKSEGQTPDGSKPQSTGDLTRDLNSIMSSILVNVPSGDGSTGPLQLGAISIVPQADSDVSLTKPQDFLTNLGTQVLAALAAQQFASPVTQFGTPKKTKTVSSLLREQRVKSTSPDGVTKSHYVNDNRPVAQILKEMRERKRLHGGATQNLSFIEDSVEASEESIMNLKQRIAKEANVMKKANVQNTKIKKEVVSREPSPAGSPLGRTVKGAFNNIPQDGTTRKLEFKTSKAARRLDAKQRAEERLKQATQRSIINRRIHNASLKDLQMTGKAMENNNDSKGKHSQYLINLLTANDSKDTVNNSGQNTPCDVNTKHTNQFFNIEELVFSPQNSSAGHSVQSTAYNSASNDSLESSFAHDRSRHSSGDIRSRHNSGDPRFSSDSTCVSNNPTLASLLSPDTGQNTQTRGKKLAALLREQEDSQFSYGNSTAAIGGAGNSNLTAYLSGNYDKQINNSTWNQNNNMTSYGQNNLAQGLDLSDSVQGALSVGFMQQGMNTRVETSQFMPIQSVTEANIVSPIRPQAVAPVDRSTLDQATRESQATQRLRLLLNTNTGNNGGGSMDNTWQTSSQSSSFVPYHQTSSNLDMDQVGMATCYTQPGNTNELQPMYSEACNTSFNDGFASMDGVRPLKRNLETDNSFLAKRQRHHSDQTYGRPKRVGFMQPLLTQDGMNSMSQESLPLPSPQNMHCLSEAPFSPEVQSIMSNDPYMSDVNSQAAAYRSHSVPAHSFLQPQQDAFSSTYNQSASIANTQPFENSQNFNNGQSFDNLQNFDDPSKYSMQQQQIFQTQQQTIQPQPQPVSSNVPVPQTQGQLIAGKHILQLLAQRFNSKAGGGVRGDHMISGASVQQPHTPERIHETLARILQNGGSNRIQPQTAQYSVPNPTPPQSHPATPVDFGNELNAHDIPGQGQGLMSQIMGVPQAMDTSTVAQAMGGSGSMGLASRAHMQDPLLGMCSVEDSDNMNMLNQNAQFDCLL